MISIQNTTAENILSQLEPKSVDLFFFDPPYYSIVKEKWDNQWKNEDEYIDWFLDLVKQMPVFLKDNGSILFFGGIGSHKSHAFLKLILKIEEKTNLFYRNWITWNKRRGYGKSYDYLFTREELVWFSKSANRTDIIFNIPYTTTKRGYEGFNKKYPAKSEYKRVTNVWTDIGELMKPKRTAEKPVELTDRVVLTHTNENDLIVDLFCGLGPIAVSAKKLNRNYIGCDTDENACNYAKSRIGE